MSSNNFIRKKETVYQGPDIATFSGTAYSGLTPARETVYGGPVPATETVFDHRTFQAKKPDSSLARKSATSAIRRYSILFFIVAGYHLLETMFYLSRGESAAAFGNGFIVLVFGLIGIFVLRLSRVAFLCALGLYGLDTALMLFVAFSAEGGLLVMLWPLVIRSFFLYRLYLAYGLLSDLHALDA